LLWAALAVKVKAGYGWQQTHPEVGLVDWWINGLVFSVVTVEEWPMAEWQMAKTANR
jgi:hypothetical protein